MSSKQSRLTIIVLDQNKLIFYPPSSEVPEIQPTAVPVHNIKKLSEFGWAVLDENPPRVLYYFDQCSRAVTCRHKCSQEMVFIPRHTISPNAGPEILAFFRLFRPPN